MKIKEVIYDALTGEKIEVEKEIEDVIEEIVTQIEPSLEEKIEEVKEVNNTQDELINILLGLGNYVIFNTPFFNQIEI